jgi:hypothetical protein
MRALPPGLGPGAVAEFLNPSAGKAANGGGGAFDAAFADAFRVGGGAAVARPPPAAAAAAAGHLPATASPLARLNPSLSAFVGAARSPGAAFSFRPPPPNSQFQPPPLAVPDACRLRDRAETLARQLGASVPHAREQVAKLLWSVGVDPARLPPPMVSSPSNQPPRLSPAAPPPPSAASSVAPAAWEAAWSEGGQRMQHPAAAAEAAAAARAAAERFGGSGGGGAWERVLEAPSQPASSSSPSGEPPRLVGVRVRGREAPRRGLGQRLCRSTAAAGAAAIGNGGFCLGDVGRSCQR